MPSLSFSLDDYSVTINTASGWLVGLRRGDSPEMLGYSKTPAPLSADLAGQPAGEQTRYISHASDARSVTVSAALGPLALHDTYTVSAGLIERRIAVENLSSEEVQLTGVRLGLSGIAIGDPFGCRFEAPGNVIRPRLPLAAAARQPIGARCTPLERSSVPPPDIEYAPGAVHRFNNAFGDAPDVGPGLIVIHNEKLGWSLLTWYVSDIEAGRPWASGDGTNAAIGFDLWLSGWLAPGAVLTGGVQYILLHKGTYQSALDAYRGYYDHTGITPPLYKQPDNALDWNALYEVHPGQFGGFDGLRESVPALSKMGIDTLYLLPVQAHRNKKGLPWDENWETLGSCYAIHDFTKLEPSLGTEEEFKILIDTAHAHGIRVLMDFVPQGCSLEAGYVQEHPEWFARDEQGNMVHSHGWNDTWSFDWANPDYHRYMLGWAVDFVHRFGIDGFRIDAPHGKEPNWDRSIPYHASKTNLGATKMLEGLRQALLEIRPDAAMYCELFGPLFTRSHDISNDYHPYAMALQLFEGGGQITPYEFNEYLRDYWSVIPPDSPRICFTETHDTRDWPAYALRGSAIAQALLGILVMAGFVPMIWSGQERGQEGFLQGLLSARRTSRTLRRGKMLFNEVSIDDMGHYRHQEDSPQDRVYALVRYDSENTLLGIASLMSEHVTYRFGLPVEKLPFDPAAVYQLRDLITGQVWNEYGRTTWQGDDLRSFTLTPRMYRPYIFQVEQVKG